MQNLPDNRRQPGAVPEISGQERRPPAIGRVEGLFRHSWRRGAPAGGTDRPRSVRREGASFPRTRSRKAADFGGLATPADYLLQLGRGLAAARQRRM